MTGKVGAVMCSGLSSYCCTPPLERDISAKRAATRSVREVAIVNRNEGPYDSMKSEREKGGKKEIIGI